MLQAVKTLCCSPACRSADQLSVETSVARDKSLVKRFPDLEMQLHNPAPSRYLHDQRATDSRARIAPHRICERFILEPGTTEKNRHIDLAEYIECRGRIDATMMSAYEQSPSFRRLFNLAWEDSAQHPKQRWQLDAAKTSSTSPTENKIDPDEERRIISLHVEAPHLPGVMTYSSELGEQPLDWTRACLQEVIRALTGLPAGGEDGHPRGGVIEYTNNVLKEIGHQGRACSQADLSPPEPVIVDAPVGNMAKQTGKSAGLSQELTSHLSLVASDEARLPSPQKPRCLPPAVACALERMLPASPSPAVLALDNHLRRSQRYIDEQQQPDMEVAKHDLSVIADIARIENSRKANLNLTVCGSVCDAIAQLEAIKGPFRQRLVFRDTTVGMHHAFADISIQEGARASIIFFESADLTASNNYALYKNLAQALKRSPSLSDLNMGIVDTNVQRSPADCLIFSLSFALKSYKHAELFLRWHSVQHARLPVVQPLMTQPLDAAKVDLYGKLGLHVYPSSMLPADFIKHSHSREVIGKRLDSLEVDDVQTRAMLTRKIVASEYRFSPGGSRNYLPSIEYKRRDLLARTLNVMATSGNAGAGAIEESS